MQYVYFCVTMLRNILVPFFQDGVWVVGFFFLLNKTFQSDKLLKYSKIVCLVVLALLFVFSLVRMIVTGL